MPKAKVKNIEIEYETFGDPSDKPLLLVNGLGSQMINWDEEFIQFLVNRGFYVIRFDNRDVGLSTKCEEAGEPNLMQAIMAAQTGETVESP
ncbi:MAG: alpha/beta fold hydrolase, partial [Promethearchaeota archaeon]